MRFGILGPLEVRTDTGEVVAVGGPKPRALLTALLLDAGRVVTFDGGLNAVQARVSRVRRALPDGLIEFTGGGYRIAVDPDDVDAHRFDRLAREGRRLVAAGAHDAATTVLREALALWRGPALVDLPEAEAQVARLEETRLSAVEDLVEAELATTGTSVGRLRELVAAHPFRERLRGQLMRALHDDGRTAEALAQFEEVRRLLRDELGVDPSDELSAVHLALLRTGQPARRGLGTALTRIIGRDEELTRLAAPVRLATITGPGGIGKTRLAVEAAGRWARDVCFVDLSALVDGVQVPHAVLGALGVREPGFARADPVDRLLAELRDQDTVLLLDNCEQVLDAVADLVRRLLSACPRLSVLATSREPLGLTGEVLVPLEPLADAQAVALFAERAAAVRPGFTAGPEVAELCRLLDGLPLAIELAAVRLRQFDLPELVARLREQDHFRLLSRGDRTAAERHRTLRAVVAWSWHLLRPEEQQLARRFAVFAGGATEDAVAAVCGSDDALADLVDRSLVRVRAGRYRMLDTILLYCGEELVAAGEEAALRQAHARYFLDLVHRADPHLRRAEQLDWLAVLSAEHDNLVAALRWSARHDPPTALRLITGAAAYWWLSGRRDEVAEVAATLLDDVPEGFEEEYVSCVVHAGSRASDAQRARALDVLRSLDRPLRHPFGAAVWAMAHGPGPRLPVQLLHGDPWNAALERLGEALIELVDGHPAAGEKSLEDVLARFRRLGERWGTAQALDWLAFAAGRRGDWTRAHELWERALALLTELGARLELVDVLCRRAECLVRQGEWAAAEADYRRAAELSARPDAPPVDLGLAKLARLRGDLPEARRLVDRVRAALAAGDPIAVLLRTGIATESARLAPPEQALPRHREALDNPMAGGVADGLEGLAGAVDDGERAAFLLGTAVALRGAAVVGDPDVSRVVDRARDVIGPEAFAEAYARGAGQSREQALAVVEEELSAFRR
ncbi:ATP-binding protein [Saccharothrix variisporea]|uniref:Putative ATPase n=1 Tax=Saccharothrix variisporea TaxID=543527 RepID=A0A495XA84_9PSEU|nr:BTAD domain-containing putative transcriptional regulator [Saccharothrix variisporea]RKT70912.1 putative ATPase [Saccharothrix variisporea]